MYVVRNRQTQEVVHVNPAPISQELSPNQVFARFDPETMEIGHIDGRLPEHFRIVESGDIVELSLSEKVADGILKLSPRQKIVGEGSEERIVDKSTQELLDDGLLTHEEIREREIQRLRGEVSGHFSTKRTSSGYRLDDLARQKANFSYSFRHLPDTDPRKEELLEVGLIYPDGILDEIMDEVRKVQAAYSAAKSALVAALERGERVEKLESISLQDHLPSLTASKAKKSTSPQKKRRKTR